MQASEQHLNLAKKDGEILEAKISALIDEFEAKYAPLQVSVITRYRLPWEKYSISKGGSAQIGYHDHLPLRIDETKHIVMFAGLTGQPDIPMTRD